MLMLPVGALLSLQNLQAAISSRVIIVGVLMALVGVTVCPCSSSLKHPEVHGEKLPNWTQLASHGLPSRAFSVAVTTRGLYFSQRLQEPNGLATSSEEVSKLSILSGEMTLPLSVEADKYITY